MIQPEAKLAFVRADADLLVATQNRRRRLDRFFDDYDWLHRAIPTFDEMSFGLSRLVAAGLIKVAKNSRSNIAIIATKSGNDLVAEANKGARTLGDSALKMQAILGCTPWGEPEHEDRSVGRLKGFEYADYAAALARYEKSWEKYFRTLNGVYAIAGKVVDVVGPVVKRRQKGRS